MQHAPRDETKAPGRPSEPTELAYRAEGGVAVALLWTSDTGRVAVTVVDESSGGSVEIEVRNGESALDVFHHPYAYAAVRTPEQLPAV